MKFKYDLIVIGNNNHSFTLAEEAAKQGAKVAILTNYSSDAFEETLFEFFIKNNYLDNDVNIKFFQKYYQVKKKEKYQYLQEKGIDIIENNFSFHQEKTLLIQTDKYKLISPSYIIAISKLGYHQQNHNLSFHDNVVTTSLKEDDIKKILSASIIGIIGNDIDSIYLAQKLSDFHKQVTLFTENNNLLPYEDEEISFYLQAHLESQGIKIYPNFILNNQVLSSAQKKYDLFILNNLNNSQINDYLNLQDFHVKFKCFSYGRWEAPRIIVNQYLQSHNPNIYAVGEILGGYKLNNITEAEIKVAVSNSLFLPRKTIKYEEIPYKLNTSPPIFRVGYTEKKVNYLNLGKVNKIAFHLSTSLLPHGQKEVTFIKLIFSANHLIYGFHSLGMNAEEITNKITIMIQEKKHLTYLFSYNFTNFSSYQIVNKIKEIWEKEYRKQREIIINTKQSFLLWKRSKINE